MTDSAEAVYNAADGDIRGAQTVALRLQRKVKDRDQRIIVLGDADFLSNGELGRTNIQTANYRFDMGIFGWFTNGVFSSKELQMEKIIFLGIVPGLLLLLAAVLLIRRKRK